MQRFIIDAKNQGQTLFRYIKKVLPGLKNNDIFKIIRKKVITVNNKKKDPKYILNNNDVIKVFLKDEHLKEKGRKNKFQSVSNSLDIAFEDQNILVVNKPSGLLTHPDKNEYKNTIYEYVRSYLFKKGEYSPEDTFTPTPCHRLDRNTSGIMIFAKNHSTLQNITKKIRERKAIKKYFALVYGELKKKILITSQIDDSSNKIIVKRIATLEKIPDKEDFLSKNPELSATLINPEKASSNYSLINIELWTGKKHQIRGHLSKIGHPLLGDKKYFSIKSKIFSDKYKITRYYLHSYYIKLNSYPEWQIDIPKEFKNKINELFKK
jgi:23S rRNA pseudouridine955/2504/2580 synthase